MKKIRNEKVEELQKMTDGYVEKKGLSKKIRVRIIAGVIAVSSGVMTLLTSCGVAKPNEDVEVPETTISLEDELLRGNYWYHKKDFLAKAEAAVETELANYLSKQTGLEVKLIDMLDVNIVRSSGNYLVISGKMIRDVKKGPEECSVTLELTDEQMEKMENSMERYIWERGSAGYESSPHRDDVVAEKFGPKFCDTLRDVICDKETKVSAIYDKNKEEWLFDADEDVEIVPEQENVDKNKR